MQGHADYSLSDKGLAQAECLANRLSAEFESPTSLYCSPISRSKQTAAVILDRQSVAISLTYDERLCEGSQGIFQGLTWIEACERYPDLCRQLETSSGWIPVPHAEPPYEVRQRAYDWLKETLGRHQNCDRLWVITHEWVMYHLISVLLGSHRTWQLPIDHTAIFEFTLELSQWSDLDQCVLANSSLWQVRRFNDIQHLGNHQCSAKD